jgi:hypothetical protein
MASSLRPRRPRSWRTGSQGGCSATTPVQGGQIIEDTIDWYAQDSVGNVWYLGEQTAEFEHGRIVSRHGLFEAGANGAQPGILLPAEPEVGSATARST